MWDGLKYRSDYLFLSGDQVPDFRTINLFRTGHVNELPDLFTQIVFLCTRPGLVGFEHLAIDGQKIQANANFRKSLDKNRLRKRYKKVKKAIKKLPDRDKMIIEYLINGEKVDSIVKKLDVSHRSAAQTMIHRATMKLRRIISDDPELSDLFN